VAGCGRDGETAETVWPRVMEYNRWPMVGGGGDLDSSNGGGSEGGILEGGGGRWRGNEQGQRR
jgi:hypothetical protein